MFSRLSQRPEFTDLNYGGINHKSAKLEPMEELSHMTRSPSAILNRIFFLRFNGSLHRTNPGYRANNTSINAEYATTISGGLQGQRKKPSTPSKGRKINEPPDPANVICRSRDQFVTVVQNPLLQS
ncbi:hypothetical protein ABVK25_002939 [Lepraria finkii]|uniref:Uncharacterized protein n=1 Tax=Lepraria finkii TaxID=1340010 RepID=A0ABR4BFN3_9LECA